MSQIQYPTGRIGEATQPPHSPLSEALHQIEPGVGPSDSLQAILGHGIKLVGAETGHNGARRSSVRAGGAEATQITDALVRRMALVGRMAGTDSLDGSETAGLGDRLANGFPAFDAELVVVQIDVREGAALGDPLTWWDGGWRISGAVVW